MAIVDKVIIADTGGTIADVTAANALKTDSSHVTQPVSDGGSTLSVDDGGGALTVDAPVGTPVFVKLSDGAASLVGQKAMAASLPVVLASDQASVPVAATLAAETTKVIGTVNVAASQNIGITPNTSGGLTTYHLVSAGSTNATVVKNSAGQLFGWYIYNSNAAARKVAFHNASSTPTAGASIFFTLMIPPSSGANVFSDIGIPFSTGISITTVTGLADNDSAAVAANDLIINLFYK